MAIKTFKRKATIPFNYDTGSEVIHFELAAEVPILAMLKAEEMSKLDSNTEVDVNTLFDLYRAWLGNDVVDKLFAAGIGATEFQEIIEWYQGEIQVTKGESNPKPRAVTKRS